MKIVDALAAPVGKNPHGIEMHSLHTTEHVSVALLVLQPGQALKLHVTPVDAWFYILEGQATVEIGGERQVVGPHHLVDSPARIPHRVLNEGEAALRFLVVKNPSQQEATRVL